MATVGGIFIPDYPGSQASLFVGSLTADGAASGPIIVGKYRLFKVIFGSSASSANSIIVRFTTGNSVLGASAPTPTNASPLMHNYQENIFEMDGSIDSINLATLTTDGAPTTTL